MSFNLTGTDFYIENNHLLKGKLCNVEGAHCHAELNLDSCLGNNDGHFDWSSQGFSHSAEDVRFSIEGDAQVPVLRAKLRKHDGSLQEADVNLAERIENQNGCFVWK